MFLSPDLSTCVLARAPQSFVNFLEILFSQINKHERDGESERTIDPRCSSSVRVSSLGLCLGNANGINETYSEISLFCRLSTYDSNINEVWLATKTTLSILFNRIDMDFNALLESTEKILTQKVSEHTARIDVVAAAK